MYANLYGNKELYRRYGEEVMFLSLKELQTWAVNISSAVKDSDDRSHHDWIGRSLFNIMHVIDDSRYFGGGRTLHIVTESSVKQPDGDLARNLFPELISDMKERDIKYVG